MPFLNETSLNMQYPGGMAVVAIQLTNTLTQLLYPQRLYVQ